MPQKGSCARAEDKEYWTAEVVFPYEMFGLKGKGTGPWRIQCHRILRDQLADNSSWHFEPGSWHYPEAGNRQPFGRLTFR